MRPNLVVPAEAPALWIPRCVHFPVLPPPNECFDNKKRRSRCHAHFYFLWAACRQPDRLLLFRNLLPDMLMAEQSENQSRIWCGKLSKAGRNMVSINQATVRVRPDLGIQTGHNPIPADRPAINKKENPYTILCISFAFQMRSICLLPSNREAGDGQGGLCSP